MTRQPANALDELRERLKIAEPEKANAYGAATATVRTYQMASRAATVTILVLIALGLFGIGGLSISPPVLTSLAVLFFIIAVANAVLLDRRNFTLKAARYDADVDRVGQAEVSSLLNDVEAAFSKDSAAYAVLTRLATEEGGISPRQRDIIRNAMSFNEHLRLATLLGSKV